MGLKAYATIRDETETTRQQERRLFEVTTTQLRALVGQAVEPQQLITVLHRNRAMWRAFADACATPGNQLLPETRASIISLALWVDRHTSEVMRGSGALDDLIAVNEDMIAGLADP